MSTYEPMKKCVQCGETISTLDVYCAFCGAKQTDAIRGAGIPKEAAGNWFAPVVSLDDPVDSISTPPKPVLAAHETASPAKITAGSHGTSSEGAPFLKPVKGLKGSPSLAPTPALSPVHPDSKPVAPVHPDLKPVEPVRHDPAPDIPVAPKKELPRCKKCGAVVPKGTILCWKCTTAERVADKTDIKKKSSDIGTVIGSFVSNNKKPIMIGAAACLVLVVAIMLFSSGGPLNEREIIAVLPGPMTSICIDGEFIPLAVNDLKIEQRKTKNGVDTVFCLIELSSDSFEVTRCQQLTFEKYNGNKWVLDRWAPYASEEVRLLKAPDELYDRAIGLIEYIDPRYANIESYITNCDVSVNDQAVTYVFDINKTIGLMSITGQIAFEGGLDGDEQEGYSWYGWPDDGSVRVSWDVDGTWNGGMTNFGMGWYEVTMNITSLNTEEVICTWTYDHNGDVYTGDGSDCWIIESNDEMIEIGVRYGSALGSYINVTYYVDGTCETSILLLGSFPMELQ